MTFCRFRTSASSRFDGFPLYLVKEKYYWKWFMADKGFAWFQFAGECASGWRRFIRTLIWLTEFLVIDVGAYDAEHHVDFMSVPGGTMASTSSLGVGASESTNPAETCKTARGSPTFCTFILSLNFLRASLSFDV